MFHWDRFIDHFDLRREYLSRGVRAVGLRLLELGKPTTLAGAAAMARAAPPHVNLSEM